MHRIRAADAAVFAKAAIDSLPIGIRRIIGDVDVVCGYDPNWIGLHEYRHASHGRLYAQTSHVAWPCHMPHIAKHKRRATWYIDTSDVGDFKVARHELGHILQSRVEWRLWPDRITALDDYAATNYAESFATAFQSWATPTIKPIYGFHDLGELLEIDPNTAAWFDDLERYGKGN